MTTVTKKVLSPIRTRQVGAVAYYTLQSPYSPYYSTTLLLIIRSHALKKYHNWGNLLLIREPTRPQIVLRKFLIWTNVYI